MNRKLLFWLTLILLSMSSLPLFSQFAGGSGTAQDPWQVTTAEHLNNLRNYMNDHFIQTADIDLGVAPWNQGEGWVSIGYYNNEYDFDSFYGSYNGNGHIVTGLYINRPDTNVQGLFGYSRGTIQNLGVKNVNITGGYWSGGLVGDNQGSISNCYSSGNVNGESRTGGLAGLNRGSIDNCYNRANVTGVSDDTGGLVGRMINGGSISNCYSSGNVTGGSGTGGLVGSNYYGSISNCYWDIQTSGQTTSGGGEGRTTDEMTFPHTSDTYVNWDWRIWKPDLDHSISDGYPFFRPVGGLATQLPEPAIHPMPADQSTSIITDYTLQWQVGFSMTNADPPSGFKLWLGTDNPPSNIINGLDLGYVNEYAPNSLLLNRSYYWRIVPYNQIGEALNTQIWTFTTDTFAGGSGTEQDPWQVATAEHLNNLRNYLGSTHANKHFIQTADIDLGVAPWNEGEGWEPIGIFIDYSILYSFHGAYNGDEYVITGLYINRPTDDGQGLFGHISGSSTIKNLGVTNVNVAGARFIGGMVGYCQEYGRISNCYSTGNVTGDNNTGGLVGEVWYGSISNCHSAANVSGNGSVGGLAGSGLGGSISNCYSTGNVMGINYTGGLVGAVNGSISNCYSTGDVTGNNYTGGLVGSQSWASIQYCYSTGSVSGSNRTGGLVGSTGEYSTCNNSYWDVQKSGQAHSAGGEGRLSNEMIYPHNTNTFVGWDWHIWKPDMDHSINNGYPYFRDPDETPTQAPSPAVCVHPLDLSFLVNTDVYLQWAVGSIPEAFDAPEGFRLWLGTDNPPSNIFSALDLGYVLEYWTYSTYPDFQPLLQYNTTYYWKIVPYNEFGEAQDCPVWSFKTYDNNFTVIHPNGGEIWQSGTTQTIRWSENANPNVELSISFDNGSQWVPIGPVEYGENYYHYQVPEMNYSTCRIKVQAQWQTEHYAISSDNFIISTSSSQPKVIMTYPNDEDDHLEIGKYVNLNWTRQNVIGVSLDYSIDDGQTWTEIASGLDSDSYSWLVPDTPSTLSRVRVRSDLDPQVLDITDNTFNIVKLQLLSPNGGEIITGDYSGESFFPISWETQCIDFLDIDFSDNDGSTWTRIASSHPTSANPFIWSVNGVPGNNYKIRASHSGNNAVNDVSDDCFIVRNPVLITNPKGGGFVTYNSVFNLRWKMQDINPSNLIFWEYSQSGSYWTRINSIPVPAGNEIMEWFTYISLADNVLLRAVEEGANRILTKSDAPFRITNKILKMYEPNGGEEYMEFSNQTISWDSDGLTNLNILFSSDDGETWTQIAENLPATSGSYAWTIPATPSYNCRIRLQDQTHTYMRLDSDLPFSILPLQVIDPTVDFSADVLSGDIPLSVQFSSEIDTGVGSIASLLWDFGDGNTSTEANPLHVYEVPGTYTVSLSVANDFGGTATESKEDYITALPQTPRIELLSPASLNFGVVYLGDVSPAQSIEVKNVGTAALHIDSVSFHLPNSQFALTDTELPITVPVDGSALLKVVFIPVVSAAVGDSIFIHSDASNIPDLAVRLNAVGEYVPPAAVEGLAVSIEGDDAQLIWEPVTETIYGTPIEPDGYIVLYNETPYEDEHFYYFLAYVPESNHVHSNVALFREHMFYRIVAVKFYRGEEVAWLRSLNSERDRKMTWGEVKAELDNLKRRP